MLYIVSSTEKLLNGKWISPKEMKNAPSLYVETPSGWEQVKSGVLMIDLDAPYPENPNKSPILHWFRLHKDVIPYEGPNPPKDSRPHRYVILHVEGNLDRDFRHDLPRTHFNDKQLLKDLGLKVVASGTFLSSYH
jgi:phosphatidylethanolamine-binding protein (PEBP) family uncharacterized protein